MTVDLPQLSAHFVTQRERINHVKFGEATAILAGDALLTLAFQVLVRLKAEASLVLRGVQMLSAALGTVDGMIAGQVMDLEYEGAVLDQVKLERLHASKTGALIRSCV